MQSPDDMSTPDGGSPDGASPDGASPGLCGADVPPGQACNTLTTQGAAITPTCATGTAPVGTGGVIADGTYVLTSETIYGGSCTSPFSLTETITIAGDCVQAVVGDILSATVSARLTRQGSSIAFTTTCQHVDADGAVFQPDTATQTYTATATTLTLFTVRAPTTTVAVFTKR
jgi:hypothetical protein